MRHGEVENMMQTYDSKHFRAHTLDRAGRESSNVFLD